MKDVSALMDGELDPKLARSTIARVEDQDELRAAWATFHVIRDTLQGNAIGPSRFIERFHDRLEQEPVPVAPRWRIPRPGPGALALGGAGVVLMSALIVWMSGAHRDTRRPVDAPVPVPAAVANRLNGAIAVEYAMGHRQLNPAFVVDDFARSSEVRPPASAQEAAK